MLLDYAFYGSFLPRFRKGRKKARRTVWRKGMSRAMGFYSGFRVDGLKMTFKWGSNHPVGIMPSSTCSSAMARHAVWSVCSFPNGRHTPTAHKSVTRKFLHQMSSHV